MNDFVNGYLTCALWSEHDRDQEGDASLSTKYGFDDIAPEMMDAVLADCNRFQADHAEDIATYDTTDDSPESMAGHDFWLTRNGHGAGFWDGDWEEAVGDRLTAAAQAFGECHLYVDDGKIYLE